MIMEALAVDVGAAGEKGEEADHGKVLTWLSRVTWLEYLSRLTCLACDRPHRGDWAAGRGDSINRSRYFTVTR